MDDERGWGGLEWFGFVLGLVGVGLALLAFDADRLKPRQELLFDGGLVLLGISALLIAWPLGRMLARRAARRRAPVPLGMLYEVALGSGRLGGSEEVGSRFMALISALVRQGEVELLGLRRGADLERVPPAHLDAYSLMMYPDLAGGGTVFRTIRAADFPNGVGDRDAYLRLHVPRRARDAFLTALSQTGGSASDPARTPVVREHG